MLFCHACQRQTSQPTECDFCHSDFIEELSSSEFQQEIFPQQLFQSIFQNIRPVVLGGTEPTNIIEQQDGQDVSQIRLSDIIAQISNRSQEPEENSQGSGNERQDNLDSNPALGIQMVEQ